MRILDMVEKLQSFTQPLSKSFGFDIN